MAKCSAEELCTSKKHPQLPEALFFPSRRYLKLKRDEAAEKQDEETVDVTPIMICVFVVMCCSMLVLLYFYYDYLGTRDSLTHQ